MLQASAFRHCVHGDHSPAGLQQLPLPGPDQPLWAALTAEPQPKQTVPSTVDVCIDLALPAAQVGSHLSGPQKTKLSTLLSEHAEVFAHGEDDVGLYKGVEHAIDLLPDAALYSQSPYHYAAEDRRFLEEQTKSLLFWSDLAAAVARYVTARQICQSSNRPVSKEVGKMGLMPISDVPFTMISIDHVSMPATPTKKYLLNVIDFATRFIVPAAVSSTSTKDVLTHLQSVFLKFGCPDDCLCDHGSAFESHQFTVYELACTAASNTEEAQEKRKAAYDQTHRHHSFRVGQFVWVLRQEPITDGTTKLAPKFKGVYQIVDQKTPVTIVVSRITGQGPHNRIRERLVHVSQLKPYVPPYVEPYLVNDQTASAPEAASSPDALGSVPSACPTSSLAEQVFKPSLFWRDRAMCELRDILEKEHHISPTVLLAPGRVVQKEGETNTEVETSRGTEAGPSSLASGVAPPSNQRAPAGTPSKRKRETALGSLLKVFANMEESRKQRHKDRMALLERLVTAIEKSAPAE
ncbi:hypothetical protein HPB47_016628 [Ixodes persulcatus]|uniref:Uncharacterized protein n=1 Tax=Ixodes persulcatus TaxID=34615 RepID=A0AC60QU28_IXOPE|nr:hypothetical protein HPB47_016628 [Ixodes persulcatus]